MVEAFFFAKNLSNLSLFLALVLGDFRVFLTPGESVESRMFRAFLASREKEREPTLTVIQKSMFVSRSCLAIARQSFQGPISTAEAERCIMYLFSQSRRLPVSLVLHIARFQSQRCLALPSPAGCWHDTEFFFSC